MAFLELQVRCLNVVCTGFNSAIPESYSVSLFWNALADVVWLQLVVVFSAIVYWLSVHICGFSS